MPYRFVFMLRRGARPGRCAARIVFGHRGEKRKPARRQLYGISLQQRTRQNPEESGRGSNRDDRRCKKRGFAAPRLGNGRFDLSLVSAACGTRRNAGRDFARIERKKEVATKRHKIHKHFCVFCAFLWLLPIAKRHMQPSLEEVKNLQEIGRASCREREKSTGCEE